LKRDIQLVIFDLDGTLVDTIPDISAALGRVIQRYGQFGDIQPLVRASVGNGVYVLFEKVYAALGIQGGDRARDVEVFKKDYTARCFEQSRVYPNTIPLLKSCAAGTYTWRWPP